MPRASAYSPSRLAVFQACARQYYYQYVIKLPPRRGAEQSVGISLHAALEAVEMAGGSENVGLEDALRMLAQHWESEGFASVEEEQAAKSRARTILTRYLMQSGTAGAVPLMLEKKLEATYAGVKLLGIVDRVDKMPDGSLELIDYKSGQQGLTDDVKQQLAIYRYLVKEKTGMVPSAVGIHQLSTGRRLPLELSAEGWTATLERAVQTAQAIEAEEDFDPQLGNHCERCKFQHRCMVYQRRSVEHRRHL